MSDWSDPEDDNTSFAGRLLALLNIQSADDKVWLKQTAARTMLCLMLVAQLGFMVYTVRKNSADDQLARGEEAALAQLPKQGKKAAIREKLKQQQAQKGEKAE